MQHHTVWEVSRTQLRVYVRLVQLVSIRNFLPWYSEVYCFHVVSCPDPFQKGSGHEISFHDVMGGWAHPVLWIHITSNDKDAEEKLQALLYAWSDHNHHSHASLIPRSRPAFRRLQYRWKAGLGLGTRLIQLLMMSVRSSQISTA